MAKQKIHQFAKLQIDLCLLANERMCYCQQQKNRLTILSLVSLEHLGVDETSLGYDHFCKHSLSSYVNVRLKASHLQVMNFVETECKYILT